MNTHTHTHTHTHLLRICGNDCLVKGPKVKVEGIMGERRKGERDKEERGG